MHQPTHCSGCGSELTYNLIRTRTFEETIGKRLHHMQFKCPNWHFLTFWKHTKGLVTGGLGPTFRTEVFVKE